mmetsp:Transcript_69654/g.194697  ORF Transcript_69654/g.194697 Transcript_69654/m.194697 type:complete len:236 (-) Transcript_69654:1572-2279(-)
MLTLQRHGRPLLVAADHRQIGRSPSEQVADVGVGLLARQPLHHINALRVVAVRGRQVHRGAPVRVLHVEVRPPLHQHLGTRQVAVLHRTVESHPTIFGGVHVVDHGARRGPNTLLTARYEHGHGLLELPRFHRLVQLQPPLSALRLILPAPVEPFPLSILGNRPLLLHLDVPWTGGPLLAGASPIRCVLCLPYPSIHAVTTRAHELEQAPVPRVHRQGAHLCDVRAHGSVGPRAL